VIAKWERPGIHQKKKILNSRKNSGITVDSSSVCVTNPNTACVVWDRGTILKTTDAGGTKKKI
jgi:photosystem II stability/assembly factor-like uncharacterized protein